MGAAGSVLTREEATKILETTFKDKDGANVEDILKLGEKLIADKKREESMQKEAKDPSVVVAPDIAATKKEVKDKRGNKMTLSQQKVQRVRDLFQKVDTDSDKVVGIDEFVKALAEEGMTEDDAKQIFAEVDDSKSGRVTMSKFLQWNLVSTIRLMRDHFKEMDEDKNRQISKEEMSTFFLNAGNSNKAVDRLWSKLDSNKNGRINFKEWKAWAEDVLALKSFDTAFEGVFDGQMSA